MEYESDPEKVGLMTGFPARMAAECQVYRGDELSALLDGAIKRTGS